AGLGARAALCGVAPPPSRAGPPGPMVGTRADTGQPAPLHAHLPDRRRQRPGGRGPGVELRGGLAGPGGGPQGGGALPADVTGVVVTHIHPDHHGLSARLREASGAWIAMHPAERGTLTAPRPRNADTRRADLAWLARCGVPDDVAAGLAVTDEALTAVRAMAMPDVLLGHGDLVPLPGRRVR